MSRPWELCRVCSLISRISFRSRSKAGEIKFFLTSGPAVGDGERVYKCSPGAPAAARAPTGPCGGEGARRGGRGRAAPRRGGWRRRRRRRRQKQRQSPFCLAPRPGKGTCEAGRAPAGETRPQQPPAPRLAGGPTEPGRPTDSPFFHHPHGWKRGPRGLPAGLGRDRRVAFPATGANCKRAIKSEPRKVINGPFAFKRGPRPESVSHQEKGWRGERLELGVRRFSKLPRPPRSGTLWRSKSVAALAPSSPEPLTDTGAGAGRIPVIREFGPAGAVLPISYEAGR